MFQNKKISAFLLIIFLQISMLLEGKGSKKDNLIIFCSELRGIEHFCAVDVLRQLKWQFFF